MKHKNVLKWVNKIRKEHFGKKPLKKLPKGYTDAASSCPIHNSFWPAGCGGNVINDFVYDDYGNLLARNPKHIRTFINRFDKGHFPDLVCK